MRGYSAIGLYDPKIPENVGSVLRLATNYEVSFVSIKGNRYLKHCTDTCSTYKHKPIICTDDLLSVVPYKCHVIGVELTDIATNILEFSHPERGYYIFGGEDKTLDKDILLNCDDVIKIPTKYCLNVSMAVNVVLYDRLLKSQMNIGA